MTASDQSGHLSFNCKMGLTCADTERIECPKSVNQIKEVKKKATLTPKERKAAKKSKKEATKSQYR